MRGLIAVISAVALVAGCGSSNDKADTKTTRSVTVDGTKLTVPDSPQRIVVLWQPTLAAVTELGFHPVGATGDATAEHGLAPYLPANYQTKSITIVSNSSAPDDINLEKVSSLRPDLIIGVATGNKKQTGLAPDLKKIATTVILNWTGSSSWQQHFTDVAAVLGAQAKAAGVVKDYKSRIAKARTQISDPAKTEVSIVRVQSPSELRLETPVSFPGIVAADLGFSRPATQQKPDSGKDFASVSPERLSDADGDLLFALPNLDNSGTAKVIESNPLWKTLTAVKAHKAFAVDYAYWGATDYYGAFRIIDDIVNAATGKGQALS